MAHLIDWRKSGRGGYIQARRALWARCLLVTALLLPAPCLAQSDAVPLIIGGHRTPQPNHLELLLELPPGFAQVQAGEIQLLEDAEATARATAVNGFRASGWTVSTVLAVDTSGSMTKYLAPVRAALPEFIAKLQQNDTLALITFDDDVHQQVLFDAPRDQLEARIQQLKTAGTKTFLHRALEQSLTMLEGRSGDRIRRRTLVVSDGADESSNNPSVTDDIIRRAVRSNVAIDAIWMGRPVANRRDTLVRFAERTGGIHRDAVKPESAEADVKAALNDISQIATRAVIASFDRQVRTDANTREIGVSLARPGIAAGTLALSIPRSSAVPPTPSDLITSPTLRDRIIYWTIRLLPALLAAYGLYVVLFLIAKRGNWSRRLINPFPWVVVQTSSRVVNTTPPSLPEAPKPPVSRRVTMVAPDKPMAAAGGSAHGLALHAEEGPLRDQRIAVVGPRFQIGAGTNNELRITTDTYLSGMHARIEHSQGQWTVIDQGSSNGTFVDGRRLASGQAHPLRDGESVRMGASVFRVMITPVVPATAAPASKPEAAPRPETRLR